MNPNQAKTIERKNEKIAQDMEEQLHKETLSVSQGEAIYNFTAGGRPIDITLDNNSAEVILALLSSAYSIFSQRRHHMSVSLKKKIIPIGNPQIFKILIEKNEEIALQMEKELEEILHKISLGNITYTYTAGGKPIDLLIEEDSSAEDVIDVIGQAYNHYTQLRKDMAIQKRDEVISKAKEKTKW